MRRWFSGITALVGGALIPVGAAFGLPGNFPHAVDATLVAGRVAHAATTVVTPPAPVETPEEPTPSPSASRSIGRASRGRLENGVLLTATDHLRFKAGSRDEEHYGTAELVALLQRSAAYVADAFAGAQLTVGGLSRARGGRMRPHRSHRTGRDVDIGFYALHEDGSIAQPDRYVRYDARGFARNQGVRYRLDDARNWKLLESFVMDPAARVQYVFIWQRLRTRLLEEGARQGASAEILARAASVMHQPRRGGRHNDHMHVRIYCASDDKPGCADEPPYWAWAGWPVAPMRVASIAP